MRHLGYTFVSRFGLVLLATSFLWGQAGPPGGSINELLVFSADRVYAATDAGVFESRNGGQTWSSRSEGLPAFPVTSVSGRPEQLFASLNGAGVWRSRNGEAWVEINDGVGDDQVFDIENHPTDPDILFAATGSNGVLFSDNAGEGWIRAGSGLLAGPYFDIAFTPGDPDHIFAVNTDGGLFESVNGGKNWTLPFSGPVSMRRVRFNPHEPNSVFVTTSVGLFRRTGPGQQFQALPPLNGFVVLDFLVDRVDPQVFYAATRNSGLARSLDGGANWQLAGLDLPRGFLLSLDALPGEASALLAGLNGTGVFRSIDQGLNWVNSSQGLSGADVVSLVADPTRHGLLWAATDGGGLFKTSNGGDSWVESREGYAINRGGALAVDPAEPSVLFAGGVDPVNSRNGLAARSTDGGATWTTLFAGRPVYDIAVHPTDRSTVYFGSDGGTPFFQEAGLLRSRDRGETFSAVVGNDGILFGLDVTDIALDPTNANNLFVGVLGSVPAFLWSENEGASFPGRIQTPAIGDIEVDPNDPRRIHIGLAASNLSNGSMARSTDRGRNISINQTGLPTSEFLSFNSVEVDPRSGAIYAAGSRAVYKSVDGGDSWQEANGGLENVVVRRLAIDGTDEGVVYAATVDRGVYRTVDGGQSWAPTGVAALVITAQGVVGGADFTGGGVAPGEIITVFGDGIGPVAGVQAALDPATGGLPTALGGVRVLIDGEPAPLFFTNSTQVNLQVPYEVSDRTVIRIRIEFGDGVSNEVLVPVRASKPGVFRAILNQDGSVNTPDNPARPGDVVVIFATGQGLTQPGAVTGQPAPSAPPFPAPLLAVKASIDGRDAERLFAGLAPGFVGLLQINLRIPGQTASGARSVSVMIGDRMGTQEALLHVTP